MQETVDEYYSDTGHSVGSSGTKCTYLIPVVVLNTWAISRLVLLNAENAWVIIFFNVCLVLLDNLEIYWY